MSVEVNACPGPDLRKILEDLRCQYETLMERNRKETEQWYACKVLYTCPALPYSAYRGEKREIKSPPLSGDVWVAAILPGVCSAVNYTANYSAHSRGGTAWWVTEEGGFGNVWVDAV